MPLPVISDTYRAVLKWRTSTQGDTAQTVLHFVEGTGALPSEVWTTIDAHLTNAMFNCMSATGHLVSLTVIPLDGTTAGFEYVPADKHGLGGDDYIPGTAFVVKHLTGFRGPAKRGRSFLPFLAENEQSDGLVPTDAVTTVTDAWTTFRNACAADAVTPIFFSIASYQHGTVELVTASLCESPTATRLRRQQRVRRR